MPQEYFIWREWRLGEGAFKARGPANPDYRPEVVPKRIPKRWWLHLAAFLAKRKLLNHPPIIVPLTFFDTMDGVFLRNPRGGVEDVLEMKRAGYYWIACNIGDHAHVEWDLIRRRCQVEGMHCIPWARCRNLNDLDNLLMIALLWNSPGMIVNLENEAETNLPPSVVREEINGFKYGGAVAISTLGWLQNSVNWKPFAGYTVLLQYFPQEVPQYKGKLSELFLHAKALTGGRVGVTFGTYHGAKPEDYPLGMIHSLYTGDDVGPGNWWRWA